MIIIIYSMKNLKTSFNIHCNNHLHYRLLISYNLLDSEKNTNIMTIEKRKKKATRDYKKSNLSTM